MVPRVPSVTCQCPCRPCSRSNVALAGGRRGFCGVVSARRGRPTRRRDDRPDVSVVSTCQCCHAATPAPAPLHFKHRGVGSTCKWGREAADATALCGPCCPQEEADRGDTAAIKSSVGSGGDRCWVRRGRPEATGRNIAATHRPGLPAGPCGKAPRRHSYGKPASDRICAGGLRPWT